MLFAAHDCQQTDQFFEFGFVQPMQGLIYPVPKGGVEFLEQIEPGLGDVAKNLSAVIGGPFPAHELLPFQAIQQARYTWCLFDHPLCYVQRRKPFHTRALQDAQDVELLRGDAMLIEHRGTRTVHIIGGPQDAYRCV